MIKKTKNFILASSSQSRKKILKNTGLKFTVIKPKVNEEKYKKIFKKRKYNIKKTTSELANLKCKYVAQKNKNRLVVGCDTLIKIDNKIIYKAKNLSQAKKKLNKLSGKKHEIYSSAVVYLNNKKIWKATEKTTVKIRTISKKEINTYLKNCGKKIIKSVGCYEIEKKGPNIIEYINGDYFNVMGFPLFSFLVFLKKFNIKK